MDEAPTTLKPLLLKFLATEHVPCPVCQRDLFGLKTDTCGGCNTALTLGVGSPEAYHLPWGILLAAAFLASSLACFFFGFMAINGRLLPGKFWPPIVMLALMIPVSFLLLVFRRRFLRLSLGWQDLLFLGGCGWTLVAILWMISAMVK